MRIIAINELKSFITKQTRGFKKGKWQLIAKHIIYKLLDKLLSTGSINNQPLAFLKTNPTSFTLALFNAVCISLHKICLHK